MFVIAEALPTLALTVAMPDSVVVRNIRPYPDALVNVEAEFRLPRPVMKFTSTLFKGVELSVTLTVTLTLSPALFWTCKGYNSMVKAMADILNERSIRNRIINLV
ncbi:hypothetical protein [Methanomethylovorans sp. PtaU1.Bin093]|uniref:hypothetical protein n=1 Tax=Methanomethylovorans sp. PtaU1.Bin093 TaxID=1811679 RepID=UPI0025FEE598|nr:hypothetical protein [Methanomethylovorans sp. PtaU1.Bin093]